mgnify:CR=1 FL=1
MITIAKIKNDKYYTPRVLAEYIVSKTKEVVGEDNITEYIEPSAGGGVFLDFLDKSYKAYDILPEDDRIEKQDFLKLDLEYRKGRCIIGNPPYGRCLNLAQKFYKKSVQLGDYIAFILPISQLNNNRTFYDFDLIYSEDLKERSYSDIKLHCCFNIYKRNKKGLNKPISTKLKDIKIIRQDSKNYNEIQDYDIRMCYWGNGSAGKILTDTNDIYSGEYKIIIHNQELKPKILEILHNVDWKQELNKIAMIRIKQYDIVNLLKREIPELQ